MLGQSVAPGISRHEFTTPALREARIWFVAPHPTNITILKGWKSFSPGLRGTSYPGFIFDRHRHLGAQRVEWMG
jgi:hypothetical protein